MSIRKKRREHSRGSSRGTSHGHLRGRRCLHCRRAGTVEMKFWCGRRVINTHLNQNFASLLNSYRIKEAVTLLSDPQHFDDKMEAVGEMCGYNNRQVFHAAFKKEMGITPSHFRNINKNRIKENI